MGKENKTADGKTQPRVHLHLLFHLLTNTAEVTTVVYSMVQEMGLFLESNAHVKKLKANLMYISQSHKCVTKGKHIYRKTAAHAKSCPCLGDPSCFILVMFQQWNKNKCTSSKVFVKGSDTERYISKQGL